MTGKQPDGLTAGRVFNFINDLPAAGAAAMRALPFDERLKIVDMPADKREAAIAALVSKRPAAKESKQ